MWLWVGKCPSNAFKKTTASHIGLVAVFFLHVLEPPLGGGRMVNEYQ